MACGNPLPHTARSPTSSTRLQCPHCQCEMELPQLPQLPQPAAASARSSLSASTATTVNSSSSSTSPSFAYQMLETADGVKAEGKGKGETESSAKGVKRQGEEGGGGDDSPLGEGEDAEDGEGDGSTRERSTSSGRRSSKKGRKRDPLAPKRAANAYMLFCKEQRPLLKQRQPELHFSSIGQILGEMWRTLPVDDKRPYELAAADDRDRYKAQMHHYTTSAIRNSLPREMTDDSSSFSQHSSPAHGPLGFSAYGSYHRGGAGDGLPLPPSSSSSGPSPFSTFPPGQRYQPYPMRDYSSPSMSPQSSSPSSASYSRSSRGARSGLERMGMTEQEYFAQLYFHQIEQQKAINEDIRRYAGSSSRPHSHSFPIMQQQQHAQHMHTQQTQTQPGQQRLMQQQHADMSSTGGAEGGGRDLGHFYSETVMADSRSPGADSSSSSGSVGGGQRAMPGFPTGGELDGTGIGMDDSFVGYGPERGNSGTSWDYDSMQ